MDSDYSANESIDIKPSENISPAIQSIASKPKDIKSMANLPFGQAGKIEFRQLQVEDAAEIAAMESKTFDKSLLLGEQTIKEGLSTSIEDGSELSFGLFKAGELVGYLLCFGCEPSHFEQFEGEWIVYIDDINVLPKYRRHVFRLITLWYTTTSKKFPGCVVEAHALEKVRQLWQKHRKLFTGIGLDLRLCEEEDHKIAGQRRYRMRWHQVGDASDKPYYQSHLASLPGESYHIDGDEYSVKLLQNESDWMIYEAVWDTLVKQSANHNLFQSYDFLRHWWHHFSGDNELYILFICKADEIIGLATFNLLKRKIRGLTFNEIGFIGSPFEVDRPGIVMAQDEMAGIKAVVHHLTDNQKNWDLIQIFEQEKGESLDVLKQAFRDNGFWLGDRESSLCYYLDCSKEPWEEFIAAKSRKFRRNLRAAQRKLEGQGDLQYRVYREWPEVEEQLTIYREIERRSRKESDGVGIAHSEQSLAFYYSLVETFAQKDAFCIRVLTLDDKPIVSTFGIYFDDVFYSLQITHDMAYNNASPGTYIESLELEECYGEEGCKLYDFLGSFVSNKSRWSSTKRLTESLHVYQRRPVLSLVYAMHFIIEPRVEKLIEKWINPPVEKIKARLKTRAKD
jgi:hypothetical protein